MRITALPPRWRLSYPQISAGVYQPAQYCGTIEPMDRLDKHYLYNRVPRVSTPQDGVFTRQQAFADGFTRGSADHKTKYGLWVKAGGQGLVERGESITMRQLANAMAVTWPDATVIGQSAVLLWYPDAPVPPAQELICAVPTKRRPRLGLAPKRVAMPDDEVTKWRGLIRLQKRQPALVDAIAWLPDDAANSLFAWSVARHLVSLEQFEALLARRAGHRGTACLRGFRKWLASGAASPLEFAVHGDRKSVV